MRPVWWAPHALWTRLLALPVPHDASAAVPGARRIDMRWDAHPPGRAGRLSNPPLSKFIDRELERRAANAPDRGLMFS